MMFDYCISNPAFNIACDNNTAGTGGNTTLYRTATRHAFDKLLKNNGLLINVTLKGIIPDLVRGYFSPNNVLYINLMDTIDAWKYNTCYFVVAKSPKLSPTVIDGGLVAKIFSPYPEECFPFIYYSCSDNGMESSFTTDGANKVIRRLPGRHGKIVYDYTNKVVEYGPKFAFTVLESKKSYTVTEEPVYGGSICYIPTNTILDSEKLKLFVENNQIFKEFALRSKARSHAFSMRNVKRFDLSQIITGAEIPVEWNIEDSDLLPPTKIKSINENKERVKMSGEVFTPTPLVNIILTTVQEKFSDTMFSDSTKTFIDSMCGDGQFLIEIIRLKMENGSTLEQALSTTYGVDLMPDNVKLCQDRLLCGHEEYRHIVEKNIVCHDALTYDYSFNGTNKTKQDLLMNTLFDFS